MCRFVVNSILFKKDLNLKQRFVGEYIGRVYDNGLADSYYLSCKAGTDREDFPILAPLLDEVQQPLARLLFASLAVYSAGTVVHDFTHGTPDCVLNHIMLNDPLVGSLLFGFFV